MAEVYEKEYIEILKSMDAKTLATYMMKYLTKALEFKEQLASVLTELELMHGILLKTLKKENK